MKCETCKYYWNNGKDESCDKRGWDFKRIDCPDFASKYKPKTNADRIRAMTDEELAEWVWGAETAGRAYGPRGKAAWLDWLRKECE